MVHLDFYFIQRVLKFPKGEFERIYGKLMEEYTSLPSKLSCKDIRTLNLNLLDDDEKTLDSFNWDLEHNPKDIYAVVWDTQFFSRVHSLNFIKYYKDKGYRNKTILKLAISLEEAIDLE